VNAGTNDLFPDALDACANRFAANATAMDKVMILFMKFD